MILSELPLLAKNAHPYIDAGSMTILLQFLIALSIAGIIMLKVWWRRVKSFFGFLFSKSNEDKSDDKPVK